MDFPQRGNGGFGGGASDFLKMTDGQIVKGVFRGDIYEFYQHWPKGQKRGTPCTGAGCSFCATNHKPSFRFRINIVVSENGALVAKVFEQGWIVNETIRGLNVDYPLEKNFVKITRRGMGQNDTSYHIVPLPGGAVTPEQEAKIAAVKLHELNPSRGHQSAERVQEDVASDIPF